MTKPGPKLIVGLVGGIGAGKSAVAAEFVRRGATVIAGDPAGHAALRQPEIRRQVVERWGTGVLGADGEINRRALAAIVFADPVERQALEALVFPWIGEHLRAEIEASRADPAVRWIVLDAAVMLEAGWNNVCDRIVYVDAPPELRLERLARQRGWTAADLAAREAAQMSPAEKAAHADAVLVNSGSPADLNRSIDDLLARWGLQSACEADPGIS